MGNLLLRRIPPQRLVGACPPLLGGGALLPFWPVGSLPALVQTGKSSLTSGVGTVSLYPSRTQLLPLGLSLECVRESKPSVLLHSTNTSCPAQGPLYLLSQGEGRFHLL